MPDLSTLFPRQPVPPLELHMVNDTKWRLDAQKSENFTMIVFYRGLHCPICKSYLSSLSGMLDEFAKRGVDTIAVSSDTEERGKKAHQEWNLGPLPVGYGLKLEEARKWGLYISSSRGMTSAGLEEPAMFSEPGLFLVKPDQTLYFASVQTMPFARPPFSDVIKGLDFILEKDYPARGEVTDINSQA